MKLYEELVWRGLVKDEAGSDIIERINKGGLTFYWGTDPSADSLHVGHLSSLLVAKRLELGGHKPLILVGGATGMIGDPRPTTERSMQTKENISKNYEALKKQISSIFGYEMVNNYDWSKDMNFIDFLRDYGKYFSINYMLNKDIIKRRLDTGITYTEFSYMIMQAMDFLHLFQTKDCKMQICGSDQWGNVTAGLDLIKKKTGKEAYCFSMPLVTDASGNKIGKSEGNAVWINKDKTSSYELYQYFINSEDEMVIKYLKIFTFLSPEEIKEIEKKHLENPHLREAHKTLSKEVIKFLHGEEEYKKAVKISECLFKGSVDELNEDELQSALTSIETTKINENSKLIDILLELNICSSKREAREFLNNNAISINGKKENDENLLLNKSNAMFEKYFIIRKGKKKYFGATIKYQ